MLRGAIRPDMIVPNSVAPQQYEGVVKFDWDKRQWYPTVQQKY